MAAKLYIGTVGWTVPKEHAGRFPAEGSHLERYGGRFRAVEINSSFYRPHRPATYKRWAASVPDPFRFAVKVPREITHRRRLVDALDLLNSFLSEATSLGSKLGPLLVQLPPSLAFKKPMVAAFFQAFRERFAGAIVCEPRHKTWFTPEAAALLIEKEVARVAADPAVVLEAAEPGGWDGLHYFRWHGSPETYYSSYGEEFLRDQAKRIDRAKETWCIFDNTALGAATINALEMQTLMG